MLGGFKEFVALSAGFERIIDRSCRAFIEDSIDFSFFGSGVIEQGLQIGGTGVEFGDGGGGGIWGKFGGGFGEGIEKLDAEESGGDEEGGRSWMEVVCGVGDGLFAEFVELVAFGVLATKALGQDFDEFAGAV